MASSKFCLVLPGDGWSARAEDSILHGCIPVVIMDEVHAVYESMLNWTAFSIRINESSIPDVPQILLSIPEERVQRMQHCIQKIWHRFAYTAGPFMKAAHHNVRAANMKAASDPAFTTIASVVSSAVGASPRSKAAQDVVLPEWPHQDDAFHTILQWLYSKIPDTRAGIPTGQAA
eukprot:gene13248-19085_t